MADSERAGSEARPAGRAPLLSARYAFADLLREARQLARALARRSSWFVGRRLRNLDRRLLDGYSRREGSRKLHLGCGLNLLDGWLNSDLLPSRPSVLHLDVRRPFPLEAETFDYVFSEHLIEHLSYGSGARMLGECHRVLREGGRIRIATPNVQFLFALARQDPSTLEAQYVRWATALYFPDAPAPDPILVVNNFFRNWGHRFIYDETILRGALERAGFVDITPVELGGSAHAELRGLENEGRLPPGFLRLESMVLEAAKPARPTGAED